MLLTLKIVLLILTCSFLTKAQYGAITEMPGWINYRSCIRCPMWDCGGNIWKDVGCDYSSPICLCGHFPLAMSALSSRVAVSCNSFQMDIDAATSLFNAFCLRIQQTSIQITGLTPTATVNVPTVVGN